MRSVLAIFVILASHCLCLTALGDPPQGVPADERRWLVYPDGIPDEANALRFTIDACSEALAKRTDPASKEEWEARAPEIRTALAKSLGLDPMPERAPLNAVVTGTADRELYTIENVVFESLPNFYVSANVYIPRNIKFPAPAVVVVAGHDMDNGKNCPTYQMAHLGLVRQGFIVMAHDPIGQGERKLPGFGHALGYGSLMVGRTNEGYIVWDTIRAIDYLVNRDDVDASRIGLSGNSGGGENVFYTMLFDERIQVGGSFCFVCTYEHWLRHGGNHCICNHLPGIVHEMEEFEIIGLNAPRPFMFGNGTEDKIFPIAGVRETYRRAQGVYGLFASADRVRSVEAPEPHGWSQPLREACYGWMNLWLRGEGSGEPVPEPEYESEDPTLPDLLCFDDTSMPEGHETVVTLNRAAADTLRAAYATPPQTRAEWEQRAPAWREEVWRVLGGRPEPSTPSARVVDEFESDGLHIEVLAITTEPGMEVGAVFARPLNATGPTPATVFAGGHEDKRVAILDGYAANAVKNGRAALVLDPRATGEAKWHENHITSTAVCLGRPIFAQQAWDVLQAGRYLASRDDVDGETVACYGVDTSGVMAIYASALDNVFAEVHAEGFMASYRYFLENEQPQSITLCVPNILTTIDIPQLIALAAPSQVRISSAVGYEKTALDAAALQEDFAFASRVYALAASTEALRIGE
jgi:cephalosporin-C deacetylase-like acetyl esterase